VYNKLAPPLLILTKRSAAARLDEESGLLSFRDVNSFKSNEEFQIIANAWKSTRPSEIFYGKEGKSRPRIPIRGYTESDFPVAFNVH